MTWRIGSSLPRSETHDGTRRKWFACCLAPYGAATATAALIVTLLSQSAAANYPEQPNHISVGSYLILSIGAIPIGAIISGLWAYWVGQRSKRPHHIILWLVSGFAFGIVLPIFTGFTIPMTTILLQLANADILPGGVLRAIVDAVFQGIPFAFVYGTWGIFTGMLAGTLFGLGAWVIDMVNTSGSPHISRYGSLATSVTLSVAVVAFAAFGPPTFLAKLG